MNYFKTIFHLVVVLLFTFSCKAFYDEAKEDIVDKEDSEIFFEVDNKKLDSNYIKDGFAIMFKSNVILSRIIQETNILPKNFSIIPIRGASGSEDNLA